MAFDLDRFQRSLETFHLGRSFDYRPVVDSTMDVARAAGREGAPHGHVVLADEQTAGRGRFGRRWVAPAGTNLTFTVLLRPPRPAYESLSIIAALGVASGVENSCGVRPAFKWPNDVQVDGRKLAGILIETEFAGDKPEFALVGIGLNVNAETSREPEIAAIAVSLRDLLGRELGREALLTAVLHSVEIWSDTERSSPGAAQRAWAGRLVTLGKKIDVRFGADVQHGTAVGVSASGALRLRRDDGTIVELPAGEVTTRVSR